MLTRWSVSFAILFALSACGFHAGVTQLNVSGGGGGSTPAPSASPTPGVTAEVGPYPPPPDNVPAPSNLASLNFHQTIEYSEKQILSVLPQGDDQMKAMCAHGGADKVHTVFCGASPPKLSGIKDLQAALGLSFANTTKGNATNGNPGFVLTGHSSSLVTRFTSAINPRALVFTVPLGNRGQTSPDPNFIAMGYVRGDDAAEIIANDPNTKQPTFFLVKVQHACDATNTCTFGDKLTPAADTGWTSYTIYQDTDLKNTVLDCQRCHQLGGPTTPKTLRMQERQNPWTHFMRNNRPGGQALLADFHAAHGTTEDYGPIPAALVDSSDPANLQALVDNNNPTATNGNNNSFLQPNEFQTSTIEGEITKSSPNQPTDNSVPGTSTTWLGLYANYVAGLLGLATPYHDVKISDPSKLSTLTNAYVSFRNGTTPASQLPDIREVFMDTTAADMGFHVKAGLDGPGIIKQACTMCHNSNLDQTISRAKFNADLSKMSAAEKAVAADRIQRPLYDPRRMPPARFIELSDAEKQLVLQTLAQ